MRIVSGLVIAALALTAARFARQEATALAAAGPKTANEPMAPSPSAAPFVSLGYREVLADLLYVRLIGYFNGDDSTGTGVADLGEAIAALDPKFQRVYEHAANAMTLAKHGVNNDVVLRGIALLEAGMREFPDDWKLPFLAGQMYTGDLETKDEALKRVWDERGALLIESATRKPGAPATAAAWAAIMRSKLGQHERAVSSLRELLLLTNDETARKRLLAAIAELEQRDAAVIAAEIHVERKRFEKRWFGERRSVPATMYLLLGPPLRPGFDMTDLATGGRDLIIDETTEELEPLE